MFVDGGSPLDLLVPTDVDLLVLLLLLTPFWLGLGLPLPDADCLCVDDGCRRAWCCCDGGLGRFPAGFLLLLLSPLCFIMPPAVPFEADDDAVSVVVVVRPLPPLRTLVALTALP